MTTTQESVATDTPHPTRPPSPATSRPEPPRSRAGWFPQLLLRLHFYAGVFVGPFILIAALSGAFYAATPTIEKIVYQHELTAPVSASSIPLSDQVRRADAWMKENHADDVLASVKPAARAGATTQVLFTEKGLMPYQNSAVFIDPGTGEVRGDLLVYGTVLPIGTWADTFHRTLMLGTFGEMYSELAASWLGIISLAGLGLWVVRIRKARARRELVIPNSTAKGRRRILSWHASTGVWLLLGALFLSATGITWSQFAGGNVSSLRSTLSWQSPALTTAVPAADGSSSTGSPPDPALFETVLAKARSIDIHSAQVEIDAPTAPGQAWVVSEIKRSYPTAVNSVAIDGTTLKAVGRTDFADYSLPAKLARWGIDTHMGLMWGLANQVLLFITALGIAAMVVFGYVMWWQRRPTRGVRAGRVGRMPASGALARAPWWGVGIVVGVAVLVGLFLPELGVTLLAFVLVDTIVTARRRSPVALHDVE